MTLIVIVVELAGGLYCVIGSLRHRTYVNGLPPTRGNRNIKRQNDLFLIGGVVLIAIGAWHAASYLRGL